MNKEALLKKTFEELAEYYPSGLYDYLYQHRKDLYKKLMDYEEDINFAFLQGEVINLKRVLMKYWDFNMALIELYENDEETHIDLVKVHEERTRLYA